MSHSARRNRRVKWGNGSWGNKGRGRETHWEQEEGRKVSYRAEGEVSYGRRDSPVTQKMMSHSAKRNRRVKWGNGGL